MKNPAAVNMKTENITKATHSAADLVEQLRASHADAVKSGNEFAQIVLLELLTRAAQLRADLTAASYAASK